MRISDWSSDVCSSDLVRAAVDGDLDAAHRPMLPEKAAGLSADHHRHAAILQGLEELRDQRIAEHEARAPRMADAVCQVARDQPQAKPGGAGRAAGAPAGRTLRPGG